MTIKEAEEIMEMYNECKNRENSCKWFCEICAYGQYNQDDLKQAREVLGINED